MINSISIKSFKSIDNILINCSKFNLFIGTNSSGKSTVIQSILLFAQNVFNSCGINGPLVTLGDFREAKNFNVLGDNFEIALCGESEIKYIFNEDGSTISREKIRKPDQFLDSLYFDLHYLSSNRIGCQDVYQKSLYEYGINRIGKNGEYAIDYLVEHANDELEPDLLYDKDSYTLKHQINYWLKYIINANIQSENIIGTDIIKVSYSMIDGKSIRPKNIGSGISFLISILILCLGSKKGDTILIENPEIHLHPLAQSRLCEFLYFISQSGRQLFIETHSDHVFNSIRAGIATGKIHDEDVGVFFFYLNSNSCTECTKVQFGKGGMIINQTDNLFDQFDIDLNKMLGL